MIESTLMSGAGKHELGSDSGSGMAEHIGKILSFGETEMMISAITPVLDQARRLQSQHSTARLASYEEARRVGINSIDVLDGAVSRLGLVGKAATIAGPNLYVPQVEAASEDGEDYIHQVRQLADLSSDDLPSSIERGPFRGFHVMGIERDDEAESYYPQLGFQVLKGYINSATCNANFLSFGPLDSTEITFDHDKPWLQARTELQTLLGIDDQEPSSATPLVDMEKLSQLVKLLSLDEATRYTTHNLRHISLVTQELLEVDAAQGDIEIVKTAVTNVLTAGLKVGYGQQFKIKTHQLTASDFDFEAGPPADSPAQSNEVDIDFVSPILAVTLLQEAGSKSRVSPNFVLEVNHMTTLPVDADRAVTMLLPSSTLLCTPLDKVEVCVPVYK